MNKLAKNLPLFLIILSFVLSACSSVAPRRIVASDSDKILEELKTYYASNISEARKAEIITVQENLLKYLIEASSSDEAYKLKNYKEANVYFNKTYPLILANISAEKKNGESFHQVKKAPLWTLEEEIKFLNAEASSLPAPKIEMDLVQGLSILSQMYKHLINKENIQNGLNKSYETISQKTLGNLFDLRPSFSEIEGLLEANISDDARALRVIALVESKLKVHETKIRNIGTEIGKSGQIDTSNIQMKIIIRFMDYYFNHLRPEVIKTILSEMVTGGTKMTEEEVLKIIFQNTGPGLGKLLQQIGKDPGVGKKLSKLMEILESSGKIVPLHLVKEAVGRDKGGFQFKSIGQSVGTGTIGQINQATMWQDGVERPVALKIKKPGVIERCNDDIKILRRFIPDNEQFFAEEGIKDIKAFETIIGGVEHFLNEEVDFNLGAAKQKQGYDIYNRSIKLSANDKFDFLEMRVPEVYFPPSGSSNLHVQEFAAGGVKFDNLKNTEAKKIVAQEMVRMWFEEALFKSGFLNADFHQGNFRIAVIEENNKIKIILYDFGLSSVLSKEEQRSFLLLGAGVHLKSPKILANGLMVSMKSKDSLLRARLVKDITEEMKINLERKPEEWVLWCIQKNYFVSDNLSALARGSMLIKQLPESIGEVELFKETILKTALGSLWRSMADRDYEFPLTKIDMVKLGVTQAKNSCMEIVYKIFKIKK
jgi:predicted unusual protein kinase regulating ubiquinone biosynthesis (AarF/ABC1/UbiB family)